MTPGEDRTSAFARILGNIVGGVPEQVQERRASSRLESILSKDAPPEDILNRIATSNRLTPDVRKRGIESIKTVSDRRDKRKKQILDKIKSDKDNVEKDFRAATKGLTSSFNSKELKSAQDARNEKIGLIDLEGQEQIKALSSSRSKKKSEPILPSPLQETPEVPSRNLSSKELLQLQPADNIASTLQNKLKSIKAPSVSERRTDVRRKANQKEIRETFKKIIPRDFLSLTETAERRQQLRNEITNDLISKGWDAVDAEETVNKALRATETLMEQWAQKFIEGDATEADIENVVKNLGGTDDDAERAISDIQQQINGISEQGPGAQTVQSLIDLIL